MRLFRSLLMLLMLVTFSTGFGKTTTDLKQNSKPEFTVSDFSKVVADDFVNVVSFELTSKEVNSLFTASILLYQKPRIFIKHPKEPVLDVGWSGSRINVKEIPYKEKLLENCNLQLRPQRKHKYRS